MRNSKKIALGHHEIIRMHTDLLVYLSMSKRGKRPRYLGQNQNLILCVERELSLFFREGQID